MKALDYYQPTEIKFGWGRVEEIGEIVSRFGKRCLMVTVPVFDSMAPVFENIKKSLKEANVEVSHFDGVIPNPTTDSVNKGAEFAINNNIDVVLGVGGGSSMDTAKAIAVGATHEGEAWDYRLFSNKKITEKTLTIITITTTSGTGSQVTPVSVVTNTTKKCKFALVDPLLYPRVSIIDPQLMLTVPEHITASTGFDVFAHAFESYIHKNASVYTDMHAREAIKRVAKYLPLTLEDRTNKEARIEMAWADTLAGLCIANAGTTLPHGIGMAIGGHAPHVMHGEALAVVYPEFMRYTYKSALKKFADIGRIFNCGLEDVSNEEAAEKSCEEIDKFLKKIGMSLTLKELRVPEEELAAIADDTQKLPDYTVNPRIATRDEIYKILKRSYN
ncbi:MAG: alcohol dehydrogenase [Candidatus Nealsonbacteria bacterium]|nr:MAG: alcohol dehydrogenase [Candidatus Nealsonbacteria bacterium]